MQIFGKTNDAGTRLVEYPVYRHELDVIFPEEVFPVGEFDPPHPYVKINLVSPDPIDTDKFRNVQETPVKDSSGQWNQAWSVEALSPGEYAELFKNRQEILLSAISMFLDAKAKELGYDNIATAVTYAEEPAVPKFQMEGRAFRAWRSLVYSFLYAKLNQVISGEIPEPTLTELLSELPALNLSETT